MLEDTLSTDKKESTQTIPPPLIEQYRQWVAKMILLANDTGKPAFVFLLKHIPINEIEQSDSFIELKNKVRPLISPKEAFSIASFLIQNDNLPNIKYLIETCQFDLSAIKNEEGGTLLHVACEVNHTEIIKYLLGKNFDVNARYGDDGMTPLHIATLMGNDTILIEAGADPQIPWRSKRKDGSDLEINYQQLKRIRSAPSFVLPTYKREEASQAEKDQAFCLKALFSNEFEKNAFKTCVMFFKGKLAPTIDQTMFFNLFILSSDLFILSSDLSIAKVKEFFNSYVKTRQVTLENFLHVLQHGILEFFIEIGITPYEDIIEELIEIQLSLLETIDIQSPLAQSGYTNISYLYNRMQLPEKAECATLRSLELLPKSPENARVRSELFYNLGLIQVKRLNYAASLENFKKAFELNSSNDKIVTDYVCSLIDHGDYEKAKTICRASNTFTTLGLLLPYARYLAAEFSASKALKNLERYVCEDSKKSLWFVMRYQLHLKLGDFEAAFIVAKTALSFVEKIYRGNKKFDISRHLETFLTACLQTKKYKEGFDFLKLCQDKYPREYKYSLLLKILQSQLYLETNQLEAAEQSIKKLSQVKPKLDVLCDLWIELALCYHNDSTKMLEYLDMALAVSPNSPVATHYKAVTLSLNRQLNTFSEENINNQRFSQNIDSPEEILLDITENVMEDLDSVENWDPKKIHIFFQEQKDKARLALLNSVLKTPEPKGIWKVGETVYCEEDSNLFPSNSLFYPNHYAVIDQNLQVDKKYHQVLRDRGFCDRASDQNGLKILCNTLAELKMVGKNARPYTVKKYQNGNKYLFVLDTIGNHLQIKRELKARTHLEVIDVSSLSENCLSTKFTANPKEKDQELSDSKINDSNRPIPESVAANNFSSPVFAPNTVSTVEDDGKKEEKNLQNNSAFH